MENNLENLTIGVFAKAAGVNVETIRFYQRKGLLLEPDKPYGSIRRYGEADVTRVRFVKSAQRLGDRKSTRLNSSHSQISYAVFCLKKKKKKNKSDTCAIRD